MPLSPRFSLRVFADFRFLLAGLFILTGLAGCGSGSSDRRAASGTPAPGPAPAAAPAVRFSPQPVLDSAALIRQFRAEPRFRAQEATARRFYRERAFALAWFRDHELVPQAQTLLAMLPKARDEGLDPKKYQVKDFTKLFADLQAVGQDTARRNALELEADLYLTGTYLIWASDYYRGVVNPHDAKDKSWRIKPNKIKLHKALLTFLGERKSNYNYYEFEPLHPAYENLKKALARYRTLERAGGWPVLPAGLQLKPGQASAAVPALRRRLLPAALPSAADTAAKAGAADTAQAAGRGMVGATATPIGAVATTYDPALVRAVKSFQQDAGLNPDGVVRGETLRQLNVPLAARIDQLILNMERWRWLPKKFEANYLLVNIPEYRLRVFEGSKEVLAMRVIVGKTLHATPIFSDRMEYVVLAPYWNVPYSIISKELRPYLVRNPGYLSRLDMEVVLGEGQGARVINPASINWARVTEGNFEYTVRRRPGPKNDLGDVKFIFPNADDVYLHDTPHDELFSESERDFSHGCVRVQEPIRLAAYLLRDQPRWTRPAILAAIATHRERYVALRKNLPVYLVYFTAWADSAGHPRFRKDIYGHDRALAKEYFN